MKKNLIFLNSITSTLIFLFLMMFQTAHYDLLDLVITFTGSISCMAIAIAFIAFVFFTVFSDNHNYAIDDGETVSVRVVSASAIDSEPSFIKIFIFNLIKLGFFGVSLYFFYQGNKIIGVSLGAITAFCSIIVGVADIIIQNLGESSFFVKKKYI